MCSNYCEQSGLSVVKQWLGYMIVYKFRVSFHIVPKATYRILT